MPVSSTLFCQYDWILEFWLDEIWELNIRYSFLYAAARAAKPSPLMLALSRTRMNKRESRASVHVVPPMMIRMLGCG